MQHLVSVLAEKLITKNIKVVTAESCTGGLLAHALTQKAGASAYFDRGFVTYSNESKHEQLDVPQSILASHGAVSSETAKAMANGALDHSNARISVSITGIAGPDGGTAEKPRGTVFFGFALRNGSYIHAHEVFEGSRDEVQQQAVITALNTLIAIVDEQ